MKKKTEENKKEKGVRTEIQDTEEPLKQGTTPAAHPPDEDLAEKLKEKEKEAAENYDKYLRTVADFENYKKYAAKERSDLIKYSNERLVKDILPILDSLDRAIHHSAGSKDVDAFIQGVKIIHEQLLACLEKYGVKPIHAVGQPFDPDLHEALMTAESDQEKEGTILQEFEKGYLLHNRLLRAAKVSVSKQKAAEEENEQETTQS
jgi:molecular chaperone GrpE